MRNGRSGPQSQGRRVLGPVVVALGLLLLAVPSAGASPAASARLTTASLSGITATVTFNGKDISQAPAPSSAFSVNLASSFDLIYTWSSVSTGSGVSASLPTVNDARLAMLFFGFSLSTRDVILSNAVPSVGGRIYMNWSPPSVLHVLLAGTYELTASLLDPNGSTLWSQNFYVDVAAPFTIGAVLPVILVLIGVYELYGLLTSGRQARPPKTAPKPWSDPSAAPAAGAGTGSPPPTTGGDDPEDPPTAPGGPS